MTNRPLPPLLSAAYLVGWRLGLGWLLGRWLLVVTTVRGDGALRRSVVRYGFAAGSFYVPADGGGWQADLEGKHTSTVQAFPGPKGVAGRRIHEEAERRLALAVLHRERPGIAATVGPDDGVYVFAPTGERVPEMLIPDLVWMWAPAIIAVLLVRRHARRS